MQTLLASAADYRRDLGNGLILRWSTVADTDKLAELTGLSFRDKADEPLNTLIGGEVRRQLSGDFPTMGSGDYAVVEDTHKEGNPLVACTCLQRYTWEYEGLSFSAGRPEIVGTHPDYRNRGLIRALFEMIHSRSEAEGHLVQGITGINYFYRLFGYEYALDLDCKRTVNISLIPQRKEGKPELFTLREARGEDLPQIMHIYNRRRKEGIVWADISEQHWRYHVETWKTQPELKREFQVHVIVDTAGTIQAVAVLSAVRWGKNLNVHLLEFAEGVNVQKAMPSVLRSLHTLGTQTLTYKPDTPTLSTLELGLGRSHPVYDAIGRDLISDEGTTYAWYIRVPDLPKFIRHIAPVLEKRLADSYIAGYSGELRLDFYNGGLRMVFAEGKLETAEPWRTPIWDANSNAGFPPLVFLKLLFGYRTLQELRDAYPDVWVGNNAEPVLKTLFPTRPSFVLPL